MRRLLVIVSLMFMLFSSALIGQTATDSTDTSERYFLLATGGWGPETGTRGEGSVGVRVGTGVYSLTSLNLAGGVGAVTEDVLYRAATSRGMTLWGRAGIGLVSTNTEVNTTYTPTFGGGAMVSYDASRIKPSLAGVEFVVSVKLMYANTVTSDGVTSSTVRPMYQLGVKYSWQ